MSVKKCEMWSDCLGGGGGVQAVNCFTERGEGWHSDTVDKPTSPLKSSMYSDVFHCAIAFPAQRPLRGSQMSVLFITFLVMAKQPVLPFFFFSHRIGPLAPDPSAVKPAFHAILPLPSAAPRNTKRAWL